MGFAAEKKKADKKWSRLKLAVLFIVIAAVLACALLSVFLPSWSWKYRVSLPKVDKRADGEMRIHFLDVGQGDATIVELPDGKVALIDGGNASKDSEYALMRYLYALEIERIEYLILTHTDEDHCGSLDIVLDCLEVKNAYIPLASEQANTQYTQFYTALKAKERCSVAYAKNGLRLNGENYSFVFLHPYAYDVESTLSAKGNFDDASNEYSAVLFLEYNGVGTLFMGDLPAEQEKILVQSQAAGILSTDISDTEILKVGHHGSNTSTSIELLSAIGVETAIISCGENTYGHPHEDTLGRLSEKEAQVYRTDTQGSIIVSVKKAEETYSVRALGK